LTVQMICYSFRDGRFLSDAENSCHVVSRVRSCEDAFRPAAQGGQPPS
jgi:hypothetical protein